MNPKGKWAFQALNTQPSVSRCVLKRHRICEASLLHATLFSSVKGKHASACWFFLRFIKKKEHSQTNRFHLTRAFKAESPSVRKAWNQQLICGGVGGHTGELYAATCSLGGNREAKGAGLKRHGKISVLIQTGFLYLETWITQNYKLLSFLMCLYCNVDKNKDESKYSVSSIICFHFLLQKFVFISKNFHMKMWAFIL